jgi:hypothetical protein
MTTRVRFGSHAHVLRAHGYAPIIPTVGKRPGVEGWQLHGVTPPSKREIEQWRAEYADCRIVLVADGRWVAIDSDVSIEKFRVAGHSARDAERLTPQLARRVEKLAETPLGSTGFMREGLPPKRLLFYGPEGEVPTQAGGVVEIFSTPSSKQVVLYGFHPEKVDEYEWIGAYQPLLHHFDLLPRVTAAQTTAFRAEALHLCERGGLSPTRRDPASTRSDVVSSSGIVGDLMSDVLRRMGRSPNVDRHKIAADYFAQIVEGEKHYHVTAVVGALILSRFVDEQIFAALAPSYREIFYNDPSCVKLRAFARRTRAGMAARGADVVPLNELDRIFGPEWSLP